MYLVEIKLIYIYWCAVYDLFYLHNPLYPTVKCLRVLEYRFIEITSGKVTLYCCGSDLQGSEVRDFGEGALLDDRQVGQVRQVPENQRKTQLGKVLAVGSEVGTESEY